MNRFVPCAHVRVTWLVRGGVAVVVLLCGFGLLSVPASAEPDDPLQAQPQAQPQAPAPGPADQQPTAPSPNPPGTSNSAAPDANGQPNSATPQNVFADQCDGSAQLDEAHTNGALGGMAGVVGCGAVQSLQWAIYKLGYGSPGESSSARFTREATGFDQKLDGNVSSSVLNFDGKGEGGRWFAEKYALMRTIMLFAVAPLLLLGTINAIFSRSLQMLFRVWLLGLPSAIVGSVVIIVFIQLIATITDDISAPFVEASKTDSSTFFSLVVRGFGEDGAISGVNMIAQIFFGFILTLAAIFLYFILMMRDSALYLSAVFLPFGLALFIWPATAKYFVKLLQFVVAMIVSKFVMIATLSLGIAALVGNAGGQTATPGMTPGASDVALLTPDQRVANEQKFVSPWAWYGVVSENLLLFLLLALAPNATAKVFMSIGFGEAGRALPGSLSRPGLQTKIVGIDRVRGTWKAGVSDMYRVRRERKARIAAAKRTSELRDFAADTYGVHELVPREYSDDPTEDRISGKITDEYFDDKGWKDKSSRTAEENQLIAERRETLKEWAESGNYNLVIAARIITATGADNVSQFGLVTDSKGGVRVDAVTADNEVMVIMNAVDKANRVIEWTDKADVRMIASEYAKKGATDVNFIVPIQMMPGTDNRQYRQGHWRDGTASIRRGSIHEQSAVELRKVANEVSSQTGGKVRISYGPGGTIGGAASRSANQFSTARRHLP